MSCLALSAKPESVSVYSDPSSQRFTLCSAAYSNRQKSSAFYMEVKSRNSSFNKAIEATQIQQADRLQRMLLGLEKKVFSLLHTTTSSTVYHLLESLSFPRVKA